MRRLGELPSTDQGPLSCENVEHHAEEAEQEVS